MSPQRRHLLEKLQVQVAAAAALAVAYFLLAPLVRPGELDGATAFVATGEWGRFAVFAGVVWALAAGCAMLTLSARPEGALLATLVGAAGLSFRSGPMRTLLWQWTGNFGRLFVLLSAEVLAMAVVAAGAVIVIRLVRAVAGRLRPRFLWSASHAAGEAGAPTPVMHLAGAVLMEIAVAMLLLVITFRSTDRGQIAFALAVSFFLAALAAHQTFPIRTSAALWFGPILMAALVFALGAVTLGGGDGPTWYAAQMVAQNLPLRAALPIDWLAMGAGGAMAGFWISSRIHESRPASEKTPDRK